MADQSTALTGANKGIGLEIARGLGLAGYKVWVGSRDFGRGEATAVELRHQGVEARALQIDVTDDASVAAAADTLAKHTSRLDALVNNAGISGDWSPPSGQTIETVRGIYEVNVFGAIRTTEAFLPLLKASTAPRIVMIGAVSPTATCLRLDAAHPNPSSRYPATVRQAASAASRLSL